MQRKYSEYEDYVKSILLIHGAHTSDRYVILPRILCTTLFLCTWFSYDILFVLLFCLFFTFFTSVYVYLLSPGTPITTSILYLILDV